MNTLLRWLLMALLSALAGAAAHFFEGSCPLDGGSWVCGHWDLVVTIATFVLGAFGVQVKRPKASLAASRAGLRVAEPEPPPVPPLSPAPASWGENVEQNTDPASSDTGGG